MSQPTYKHPNIPTLFWGDPSLPHFCNISRFLIFLFFEQLLVRHHAVLWLTLLLHGLPIKNTRPDDNGSSIGNEKLIMYWTEVFLKLIQEFSDLSSFIAEQGFRIYFILVPDHVVLAQIKVILKTFALGQNIKQFLLHVCFVLATYNRTLDGDTTAWYVQFLDDHRLESQCITCETNCGNKNLLCAWCYFSDIKITKICSNKEFVLLILLLPMFGNSKKNTN